MWSRRTLSFAFVAAVLLACSRRSGEPGPIAGGVDAGSFDKAALLRAFGECALSTAREVATAASGLEAAARAAEASGTPAARDAAREAWNKTIDVWQRAELMQFGPAAIAGAPGGQDLRDAIYAWPLVGRCLIESQLVAQTYDTAQFPTALVSTRGLGAAEYLLFYDAGDNVCPASNTINAQGTWAALGAAEVGRRKLAYTRAIAVDVAQRAQRLVDAWDPAKGNFVAELTSAPNKTFTTQQLAINAASDALYYIDDAAKTMKVGKPAGLTPDCATPPCLDMVESPYAHRSKEHLRNNLAGFEAIMRGCGEGGAGVGFDDYLTALGPEAEAIARRIDAALADAKAKLAALGGATFEDDLKNDPAGVKAFHEALRVLSGLLKSELATTLQLELPKRVEGDND